jgi:hypothetical protein
MRYPVTLTTNPNICLLRPSGISAEGLFDPPAQENNRRRNKHEYEWTQWA